MDPLYPELAAAAGSTPVDLEPIKETSLTPLVAATQLQALREALVGDARILEMRQSLHLNPEPTAALHAWQRNAGLSAQERGAVVGQLVHRALMFGADVLQHSSPKL